MTEQKFLTPVLSPADARMLSPLQLAFLGDTVHDLMVRGALVAQAGNLHRMHLKATRAVNATAQAKALERILPLLTEEEIDLVKRGRNAHAHHPAPKAAAPGDYAGSTGLETLFGFLYLTGDVERLAYLYDQSCEVASCP